MSDGDLRILVGHSITDAYRDEDAIVLTLEDNSRVTFEGIGYDGLWKYVSWYVDRSPHPLATDSTLFQLAEAFRSIRYWYEQFRNERIVNDQLRDDIVRLHASANRDDPKIDRTRRRGHDHRCFTSTGVRCICGISDPEDRDGKRRVDA